MEGLQAIFRRVAGIDVDRMLHVVTVVVERPDGSIEQSSREFGKRDFHPTTNPRFRGTCGQYQALT